MWNEGIHKQEDASMYCTENSEIDNEMDGVEAIDLCSESKTKNGEQHEGKESSKQESQDKTKINTIVRKKVKIGLEKVSLQLKMKKMKPQ